MRVLHPKPCSLSFNPTAEPPASGLSSPSPRFICGHHYFLTISFSANPTGDEGSLAEIVGQILRCIWSKSRERTQRSPISRSPIHAKLNLSMQPIPVLAWDDAHQMAPCKLQIARIRIGQSLFLNTSASCRGTERARLDVGSHSWSIVSRPLDNVS